MSKVVVLKLTMQEAAALMDAGCRGYEDLVDAQDDESATLAELANVALEKLADAQILARPKEKVRQERLR